MWIRSSRWPRKQTRRFSSYRSGTVRRHRAFRRRQRRRTQMYPQSDNFRATIEASCIYYHCRSTWWQDRMVVGSMWKSGPRSCHPTLLSCNGTHVGQPTVPASNPTRRPLSPAKPSISSRPNETSTLAHALMPRMATVRHWLYIWAGGEAAVASESGTFDAGSIMWDMHSCMLPNERLRGICVLFRRTARRSAVL